MARDLVLPIPVTWRLRALGMRIWSQVPGRIARCGSPELIFYKLTEKISTLVDIVSPIPVVG